MQEEQDKTASWGTLVKTLNMCITIQNCIQIQYVSHAKLKLVHAHTGTINLPAALTQAIQAYAYATYACVTIDAATAIVVSDRARARDRLSQHG